MKNKIAIIVVYLGEFPRLFDLTKKTAKFNKDYDWLIFNDQYKDEFIDGNLRFIPSSLDDVNIRLFHALGGGVAINRPQKLADVKPLFGKMYAEYLEQYEWFGWSDLDVIYGNFNNYINDEVLDKNEFIGYISKTLFGPFALFKKSSCQDLYLNIQNINNLINHDGPFKGNNSVDETHFGNIVRDKLKIYDKNLVTGTQDCLVRHGKNKFPLHWQEGDLHLDTFKNDFPEDYYNKYGDCSMIVHLPKAETFTVVFRKNNDFSIY